VWTAYERLSPTGTWQWWFTKADRRVSRYYFYVWDIDFGPAFLKVPTYFPLPREDLVERPRVWPNAKPSAWAWDSANCPTGSPPLTTRRCRRRSVTGSGQGSSMCSASAGSPASRCR
jgi:hypothetical protein